jgi:hypothetical protein
MLVMCSGGMLGSSFESNAQPAPARALLIHSALAAGRDQHEGFSVLFFSWIIPSMRMNFLAA